MAAGGVGAALVPESELRSTPGAGLAVAGGAAGALVASGETGAWATAEGEAAAIMPSAIAAVNHP